ncbi:MAG TPA: hypothetical protein VGF94_02670 [Kofleriaceae bacterium]
MYIAAIPLDQKQSVVQTQNDWSIAKMEQAKADADSNEVTTQLSIARNDVKASRLSIDSAVAAKKSADASADTNRINQATKDLNAAQEVEKAAEAHVHYLEAYAHYLHRYLRYTQENTFWRESQYELAKAKVAQANHIAPKGVNYADFPSQHDGRMKRTQGAKDRLEHEKQSANESRSHWLEIQKRADIDSGHNTSAWDPMMNGGMAAGGVDVHANVVETKSGPVAPPPPAPAPAPAATPAAQPEPAGGSPQ